MLALHYSVFERTTVGTSSPPWFCDPSLWFKNMRNLRHALCSFALPFLEYALFCTESFVPVLLTCWGPILDSFPSYSAELTAIHQIEQIEEQADRITEGISCRRIINLFVFLYILWEYSCASWIHGLITVSPFSLRLSSVYYCCIVSFSKSYIAL